jgi:quercetin dioxygenase-like cupin family protein
MDEKFGIVGFFFGDNGEWQKTGEGVRRKILSYDKDMMLVLVEFQKGSIGPIHKHPHKQFSYITKGSFEVSINGEKKIQKAGDGYLMLPNMEHGVTALEDSALIDVFVPHREDFLKKK